MWIEAEAHPFVKREMVEKKKGSGFGGQEVDDGKWIKSVGCRSATEKALRPYNECTMVRGQAIGL